MARVVQGLTAGKTLPSLLFLCNERCSTRNQNGTPRAQGLPDASGRGDCFHIRAFSRFRRVCQSSLSILLHGVKRSTLVLGLLGFISIVAGVAAYWKATEHQRAWKFLLGFLDKDLRTCDKDTGTRLDAALVKLILSRKPRRSDLLDIFDYQPWFVWRLQADNHPDRVVIFEVNETGGHPGSTRFRLTTFSKEGRRCNTTEFTTGHRNYMGGFELRKVPVSAYPVLEVH